MKMYIKEEQARALLANRSSSSKSEGSKRKYYGSGLATKKRIYAEIRREHGIPNSTKIKFFIEAPDHPLYRVIRNKHTGLPLDNGIAEPVAIAAPVVAAVAPVAAAVKAVAVKKAAAPKAPAKKAVAVKKAAPAPAKKTAPAPAKKTVAKKTTSAGIAKAVAPAAKKVAAKAVVKKAASTKKVVAPAKKTSPTKGTKVAKA